MNFINAIHLMCWNYLIDLITHSRTRNNSGNSDNVVVANAVVSVASVSAVCDQGDQVVPAHQVDDIDEVHELDPVHQVDHKDEQ